MAIILFEDEKVDQLSPATLSRPAYRITCGSLRLIDVVASLSQAIDARVRPHLHDLEQLELNGTKPTAQEPLLLVNAAAVPSVALRQLLAELLEKSEPCIVRSSDRIALALLPVGAKPPADGLHGAEMSVFAVHHGLPESKLEVPLLEYPHDIVRHHLTTLEDSLQYRLEHGDYREIADGVFAAEGAKLADYVVCDTTGGPILLESGAQIGPYCYLSGPAHIGRSARVIEHSAIKDGVTLGHTTKTGGEVEASIIEPYTNKQHHGFLGHSYLGSWINLGAGTCNSDLKNTYGHVNMEYDGRKVATGMQFVGCIVGDYSKTAINTAIFTGKTIGVCSMVYGFVTTNVPSFANYARTFGQVTESPPEVMVSTQARMFARRDVPQRPCDRELLFSMYELTRHERRMAGAPLAL